MIKAPAIAIFSVHFLSFSLTYGQSITQSIWTADRNDGTYRNPILHTDYSDPDICRVGGDFYMTASSFNAVPGLPILHSTDMVNWTLINYGIYEFDSWFDTPQHGNGVWAPSIKHHNGTYYIYWGDPDRGIYMVWTKDPATRWSAPVLVKKAFGNIDPSPLWDDDGKVYLVHAFANSRAGIKSTLQIMELSSDGSRTLDQGTIVFDGHENHPTLEGPKLYKRNGYYYIFAPAGGVPTGWQLILRSKDIYGPYEERISLAQGSTPINGPHQGGWVELDNGENWFVHFQDKGAYGRIVHLQPVKWVDDWPVMGNDPDGDGTGEPVLTFKKPDLPASPRTSLSESDEFNSGKLSLHWQWNAKPYSYWTDFTKSSLRLNCQPLPSNFPNLWMVPNLLLQKFPAEEFNATVEVDVSGLRDGEETGLIIFGLDYASIAIRNKAGQLEIEQKECKDASKYHHEVRNGSSPVVSGVVWLRASISKNALVNFQYSIDGLKFKPLGNTFTAREGKWVGAKVGIYAARATEFGIPGYAAYDWFRITKP